MWLFGLILFGTLCDFCTWMSVSKLGKLLSIIFKFILCSFLSFFSFWDQKEKSTARMQYSCILHHARILEWVAISFWRGSSWPRDWTRVSCITGRFFTVWATREAPNNSLYLLTAIPILPLSPLSHTTDNSLFFISPSIYSYVCCRSVIFSDH